MKKVLITGITGQDGSYLAELLIDRGYDVYGLVRRTSLINFDRISHLLSDNKITLIEGEMSDPMSLYEIVRHNQFDEIYNLAAQSHVGTSFKQPDYTFKVDALGPLYLLEAIRLYSSSTKLLQASTSEMFGKSYSELLDLFDGRVVNKIQDMDTPFLPQSPYAAAKLCAHHLVRIYREAYGLYCCSAITFNHESPRRGENFVTRKIARWIGEFARWRDAQPQNCVLTYDDDFIYCGTERFPKLRLGNMDAYRDWGHAKDYVEAFYKMMHNSSPKDYIICTGKTYSVRHFLTKALNHIGVENIDDYFVIDPQFYRPAEVEYLKGDNSEIRQDLGWTPTVTFDELVAEMVDAELNSETQEIKALSDKMV